MKTLTYLQNIQSLTYHVNYLNIQFKNEWYQEDIATLIELLFLPIIPVAIQEEVIGADRESIRFSWHNSYFVLNFDYYSQSCWIAGQDGASIKRLSALHSAISRVQ